MPVKQSFEFQDVPVLDDGNTLTLELWVETLSEEEQAAFQAAEDARVAAVEEQVAAGNLTIVEDTGEYIWADGADPLSVVVDEWYAFFERYNTENNIVFNDIQTEV